MLLRFFYTYTFKVDCRQGACFFSPFIYDTNAFNVFFIPILLRFIADKGRAFSLASTLLNLDYHNLKYIIVDDILLMIHIGNRNTSCLVPNQSKFCN